jgi:dihydrofolate reductase
MKVILVFVSTLNGKITRGEDPEVRIWSSKSDQEYYSHIWKNSRLVVMGSNTFNENIIEPSAGRLIIVMTGKPELYTDREIKGHLEFSKVTPVALVSASEKAGYDQMTVVGGSQLATSFLKEELVDELWLTIEPKLFGLGFNLIAEVPLQIDLQLIHFEKVNEQGTIITKYAVLRSDKNQK